MGVMILMIYHGCHDIDDIDWLGGWRGVMLLVTGCYRVSTVGFAALFIDFVAQCLYGLARYSRCLLVVSHFN